MFVTKTYFNNVRLDMVLDMFKGVPGGFVDNRSLFDKPIEEWPDAIAFLTEEGYLEELHNGHKITYKGKMLIDKGGFVGKHRREIVQHLATVAACVASIIAAVVSILALLK